MKKYLYILIGIVTLLYMSQCKKQEENNENETPQYTQEQMEESLEKVQKVEEAIDTQFAALTNESNAEALSRVSESLVSMDGVVSAVAYGSDSVVIKMTDGGTVKVLLYDYTKTYEKQQEALTPTNAPLQNTGKGAADDPVLVGNKKVLIWEAFQRHVSPNDIGSTLKEQFGNYGFNEIEYLKNGQCTVSSLKDLTQYGTIYLNTHGGINDFVTFESYNDLSYFLHYSDFVSGKLNVSVVWYTTWLGREKEGSFWSVTSKYIRGLEGRFDNSIVFLAACDGMALGSGMGDAFISKGCSSYLGFTHSVEDQFATGSGLMFFLALLNGATTQEAYNATLSYYPYQIFHDDDLNMSYRTELKMMGRDNAALFATNYPEGALHSVFAVGPGKKVCFAKGNLHYQASTNTFKFADNQYDVIGDGNANISPSYSGWIDLYGWGTSGWNSGAQCYQPYSCVDDDSYYYLGGSYENGMTGAYANADWGVYNPIVNGGNQAGLWRCLSREELVYLIEERPGYSFKSSLGSVGGTHGLIILPEVWTQPENIDFVPSDPSWTTNSYSLDEWGRMEDAGALFLPATGSRQNTIVYYVGGIGDYWAKEAWDESTSCTISFFNGTIYPADVSYRCLGRAVRLAHDMN